MYFGSSSAAGQILCDHRSVLYSFELSDTALDLGQLNAEAAYLDLLVASADKLDVSVGQIAAHIAREVHSLIALNVKERIRNEFLRGQIFAVKVASGLTGYPEITSSPTAPGGSRRLYLSTI